MRTIIGAVDFSPASRNAACYAADLATRLNAELLLINVVPVPTATVGEVAESGYILDKMIEGSEEELKALTDELEKHVKNKIKIRSSTLVGSVAYSLQQQAKEEKAFCIVLGTDSMTAAEHLLAKNHALAAMHSVTVPVLIVPQRASFKDIKKVVLASDLRGYENITTLQLLKEWMRIFKVKLDVLNVVEGSQPGPESVMGSRTLQNELSEFNPEYHFIDSNTVSHAVDDYVDQNHSDLLITMPGRRGFFKGLFHKSESKQLIRKPHIPVLSIYK